ncbi:MAG: hypothetical protein COB30_007815 [Ectothiorhodospiraceae bacterium]|nr:hypothetical protein [Ectothiorhodospiraceae bacterium]
MSLFIASFAFEDGALFQNTDKLVILTARFDGYLLLKAGENPEWVEG